MDGFRYESNSNNTKIKSISELIFVRFFQYSFCVVYLTTYLRRLNMKFVQSIKKSIALPQLMLTKPVTHAIFDHFVTSFWDKHLINKFFVQYSQAI